MKKYLNKYRIQSNRKPGYDYSSNGLYFITFVTQNRICSLGKVVPIDSNYDSRMDADVNYYTNLSDFGKIIQTQWIKSFEIRKELLLDCYVIMPNHLHAIVEIRQTHDLILMDQTSPYGSLHRLPQSLSSFIAGFKSAVNTQIDNYIDEHQLKIPKYNKNNHFFQSNYHDHIIRNEGEYFRIRDYINENPDKWAADCFNDARITD